MFSAPGQAGGQSEPPVARYSAVLVLMAFCATAAGSFWNVDKQRDASVLVLSTHDALRATNAVLLTMETAVAAQRGFLLTNDRRYLGPYLSARSTIARELQSLRTLGADGFVDEAGVEVVSLRVSEQFEEMEKSLAAHAQSGPEAARAVIETGHGKRLMEALRAQIDALDRSTMALRRERIAEREYAVTLAFWTTTAFLGIGLFVSGILAFMTRQQRRTQRALLDEGQRLHATLLSIGDGVIVTDCEGTVTTMNSVAEALTGWPDGASIGRPLQEVAVFVDQRTRQPVENPALRTLREGKAFRLAQHTVIITPAGREIPIDESAAPIRGASGTPIGAVLVFRDMSARYAAEQALRRSEMQLRRVIDSMFAFVGILDLDGRLLEANRAPLEVSGLQREDVVGKPFWDCAWWSYDTAVQNRLKEAFARALQGEVVRYDAIIRSVDDGRTTIDFMLKPIEIDGRVSFIIPSAVEIESRKRLEFRLQTTVDEAEQRASEAEQGRRLLNALMEYIPEGVTVADATGQIRLVSRHGLRSVQRPFYEVNVNLEGQSSAWSIFHSEHGMPAVTEELPLTRAIRQGEEIFNEEWVLQSADGRYIPVLCNAGPIRDAAGRIAGGVVVWRDMTAIKRIEERLREADRRKDEFLATLAHELRNPLAPVRHGLEILRRQRVEAAEPVREMITRQVNQMVRLIDDLLDISRITTGKIELQLRRFPLQDAVQAALEAVQAAVDSAGHTLQVDPRETPLWIDGDAVRVTQIISNLLFNAVKYTPAGGLIRLAVTSDAGAAVISVADNGIGIPAPQLGAVFDMFTQLHGDVTRVRQGLGIGLSLVKNLTELHGGTVLVESGGEGCGTTFTVRFPLADAPGLSRVTLPGEVVGGDEGKDIPVLVVDDNADSAESLSMLIEMSGHRARTAYDGPSALEIAEDFEPKVVLLDIGLPGMSGHEVARALRAHPRFHDILLVAITGWGTAADIAMAHAAGFDVHLTKPVEYERLLEMLSRVASTADAPAVGGRHARPARGRDTCR